MGPAHHRLHHSTVIEEAGNFASAITLWDIAFGTYPNRVHGTNNPYASPERQGSFGE